MYIDLKKTLSQIEKALPQKGVQDLPKLQKAYEITLRLRSQIIGVIYDMKQYSGPASGDSPKLAFSVVAKWGESGRTTIRICELSQWKKSIFK